LGASRGWSLAGCGECDLWLRRVEHERSALLAPLGDEAAFLRAAERLAREPALARSLGVAARAAAESLTWERIADDFEAALLDVAGSGAARVAA